MQPDQGSGRAAADEKGRPTMMKNFDDIQQFSKDNVDVAMKSFGTLSKQTQALASEFTDFSKKSLEDGSKVVERLFGAKSLDKVIEIQADYAKTAYEGFVAQASKFGEMYANLAKETYKPYETLVAGVVPAK
jgi:hypothetical protein